MAVAVIIQASTGHLLMSMTEKGEYSPIQMEDETHVIGRRADVNISNVKGLNLFRFEDLELQDPNYVSQFELVTIHVQDFIDYGNWLIYPNKYAQMMHQLRTETFSHIKTSKNNEILKMCLEFIEKDPDREEGLRIANRAVMEACNLLSRGEIPDYTKYTVLEIREQLSTMTKKADAMGDNEQFEEDTIITMMANDNLNANRGNYVTKQPEVFNDFIR